MRQFAAVLLLLGFCTQVAGASFALQLNAENIADRQPAGPDAIGGLGDWLLGNGSICAVVSDINHETGLTPWGGALVDVYACDKGNDQWTYQHFFPNVDKDLPLVPQQITANVDRAAASPSVASLTVIAEAHGLQLTSRYTVTDDKPAEIEVQHELRRVADGPAITMLGTLVLHPYTSLTPFSISTTLPEYSLGLEYPASSRSDMSSLVKSMVPADVHVLVGDPALGQVSYGVKLHHVELIEEDGQSRPLNIFQQTASTYSMQGVLSRPPWLGGNGKLGMFEFAQSQLMDIKEGEAVVLRQTIYLGDKADVASISDQVYQGAKLVGSVDSKRSIVEVYDESGSPITIIRPNDKGQFSALMPRATKQLELVVKEVGLEAEKKYQVAKENGEFSAGMLSAAVPAQLKIDNQLPVRLTFVGQKGSSDPGFYANGISARFGDQATANIQTVNYLNFAAVPGDPVEVALAPGSYRVIASRGMAFGVTETEIELKAGENPVLRVKPPMAELDTSGWLAADFHVHSAPSFDSYIAFEERVRGFVAQGGEVLVATEHNVLVDYSKVAASMGLKDAVNILGGMELTGIARTPDAPYTNGHLNVFPMPVKPQEFAGGLPAHEGMRLRSLYQNLRESVDNVLVQLNHPRAIPEDGDDTDGNYFEHLLKGQSYDPGKPLSAAAHSSLTEKDTSTGLRDLDFDILEVANGPYYETYLRVRADWFSLLNQGEKLVATANSDSHGNNQLVAIPQSFVQLDRYSESGLLKALKEGRLFGSTGPLLEVELGDAASRVGPGGTMQGASQTLSVGVQAASWVPVSQLKVFINGKLNGEYPIQAGETLELPLQLNEDAYVVVEVSGELNGEASELYSLLAPGFVPFAFSNPIYIDADNDGQWQPPGL